MAVVLPMTGWRNRVGVHPAGPQALRQRLPAPVLRLSGRWSAPSAGFSASRGRVSLRPSLAGKLFGKNIGDDVGSPSCALSGIHASQTAVQHLCQSDGLEVPVVTPGPAFRGVENAEQVHL